MLSQMATASGADIIHLNIPAFATRCSAAPTLAMAHSSLASWWRAVRSGPMPLDFQWRNAATTRGLKAATIVVTATRSFARALQQAHGSDFPIEVVPNGRRPHAVSAEKQRLVLTAGRLWDDGKNITVLDRAAKAVDAPIIAAGALEGPHGVTARFRDLRVLGPLDDHSMAQWLASAAVFASPARYEPFGLSVLEAAQAGAALVLSDIDSFRELWEGAALFVPAEDESAWAATLQAALDAPERLHALGAAAQERARRYTAEAMVSETLAVYSDLLTKRALPRLLEAG
jgi:glycosyltransferase involved in cell wall biosynthesis